MDQTAAAPRNALDASSVPSGSQNLDVSEFLSFQLGEEEHGIEILRGQESRSCERPTRVVNAPKHIFGGAQPAWGDRAE
ncbi:hypothetical protein [Rhodoferax sp. U11-2br]|uniref:hypothetical protein n=1 Tax=Rhodoferax sp. U11-2br TaxID=2838878 RepID=UPI001BE52023|nr:hypothetical protein [Rhodoferax sp. U11-2br]MBT3065265.1 hypothetical protein [Rhodoferax sp. U11-2br]